MLIFKIEFKNKFYNWYNDKLLHLLTLLWHFIDTFIRPPPPKKKQIPTIS